MIGPIPIFKHPHLPHHKEKATGKTFTVNTSTLISEALVFIGVFSTIDILLSFTKQKYGKYVTLFVSVLLLIIGCIMYQSVRD